MTANEFRNAILLLNCIDADEFFLAGVEYYNDRDISDEAVAAEWAFFRENPSSFYIHASGAHRNALWAVIEKRLTVADATTKAESPQLLDKAWESINAEGGYVAPHDVEGKAYAEAIGKALAIIESLGGMDPTKRREQ